jgi:uncharacterized phage protein (TIGR02218 family)
MPTLTAPVELYKLSMGSTFWYYTSSDQDYEYEGNTYISTTVGRSEIEAKGSVQRENIEVAFAVDNPMAKSFLQFLPDAIVILTVFVKSDIGTFVGWKGRLAAVKPEKSVIKLIFESVFTSLKRSGLRQSYQRGCRHMLYSTNGCKIDKALYVNAQTAMTSSGYTVVLSASPGADGSYAGGVLEYNGGMRGIINQVGNIINDTWSNLNKAIIDSAGAGVAVNLYPGCDRSTTTCKTKFNNFENYGGFPHIPTRNPFDGSSIV